MGSLAEGEQLDAGAGIMTASTLSPYPFVLFVDQLIQCSPRRCTIQIRDRDSRRCG